MRRVGGLFTALTSFGNLSRAADLAQRGKRNRADVLRFNLRREDELVRIQRRLVDGSWRPSGFRHFQVFEPKERWVSAAPYADRVVHHALCNVIEPVLDRRLSFDCWANRRGKGSHRAVLRLQRFAGRHRYALSLDIRKYFASVDHAILKAQLRRIFKDARLDGLMERIIDCGPLPDDRVAHFPGDDLFTPIERPRGLPIGNLTSQLWANFYLAEIDTWVQQRSLAPAYLRFMDDLILLHDDRAALVDALGVVRERLSTLRLEAHPRKCVLRRTREGVPFLGYVVWPERIRVRGETLRRFRRRLRRVPPAERRQRLAAWRGHTALAGAWRRTK